MPDKSQDFLDSLFSVRSRWLKMEHTIHKLFRFCTGWVVENLWSSTSAFTSIWPLSLHSHVFSSSVITSSSSFSAKLARLSLSLPPLPLSLPLSPGSKGFWDGGESRIGRRRGFSTGSDPEEDEEEEEQEDEGSRKVIVITETDVHKRVGLRSLLKSPKEPVDKENRDHGRNVSFFDDVTVYLFDQVNCHSWTSVSACRSVFVGWSLVNFFIQQETPTNELSSGSAPTSPSPLGKPAHFDGHG